MSYYNKLPISGAAGKHNAGVTCIDGKGREKMYCYAAAAATKGTIYTLSYGQYGPQNQANGAAATDVRVMVAEKTLSTGEYGWFILRGEVDTTTASDACTAGHTWKIHTDGTALCEDAAWDDTSVDTFAVSTQTEATATTHTLYLIGRNVTWT
jgi:hypothetical protein